MHLMPITILILVVIQIAYVLSVEYETVECCTFT